MNFRKILQNFKIVHSCCSEKIFFKSNKLRDDLLNLPNQYSDNLNFFLPI